METITVIAQTIQLAVAPVFLLAGIGAFLNVCAGRLGRVIDRARVVERVVLETVGEERKRMLREIRKLDRRIDFLNNAIFLSVASAILVCLVVVLLFSAQLFGAPMGTPVALLFIIAMLLMISALCTFLVEIRLASSTIHIANEVLSYRGDS
ncbi:MAG TPA: DUF2721 domain-containing protein [Rhizorhapis sp.]